MFKRISLTVLLFIFVFLFVFCGLSMNALAANNTSWVEKQSSVKLYWGDSITVDDYVVKAEDFSNTSVFISISKNGEKLKTCPLSEGMEIEYDDEIKVFAEEIDQNYETVTENGKEFKRKDTSNPYASLTIYRRGEPKLELTIETDKDAYDPKSSGNNKIEVTINVENIGDADAKNTVLTIDAADFEFIKGKAEYTDAKIKKSDAIKPINLTLKTPAPWEDTDFNITVNATCEDIKGNEYEYGTLKTVKVEKKWDLIVSKAFQQEFELGETIPVSVSVRNKGLCDINNIVLNDSIASGMHLKENKTLNKTFSLKSGEKAEKVLVYSIVPEKSGEYTLPLCTANFTLPNGERKELSSNNSGTITIKETDIKVTKTVDKQQLNVGETLRVDISAQNNKKNNLKVSINDTLPPGAKLVSGETSTKQILKSDGGSMNISYILQMNETGEIKLPACKANFTDVGKNSIEIFSDTPVVNVVNPVFLAANNTTQSDKNESSKASNNSSSSNQLNGTDGNSSAPGFSLIPSLIGFLVVAGLLRRINT